MASAGSVRRSRGARRAMAAGGGESIGVSEWLSRGSGSGGVKSADGAANVSAGRGLAISGDRSEPGRRSRSGPGPGRWPGRGGRLSSPVMSSRGRSSGSEGSRERAGVFPECGTSCCDRGSSLGWRRSSWAGPDPIGDVEERRADGGGIVARSSRRISPGEIGSLSGGLTGRAEGRGGTGGGPAARGSVAGRAACLGGAALEPSMICFTTLRGNPIVLISSSLGSAMAPPETFQAFPFWDRLEDHPRTLFLRLSPREVPL